MPGGTVPRPIEAEDLLKRVPNSRTWAGDLKPNSDHAMLGDTDFECPVPLQCYLRCFIREFGSGQEVRGRERTPRGRPDPASIE